MSHEVAKHDAKTKRLKRGRTQDDVKETEPKLHNALFDADVDMTLIEVNFVTPSRNKGDTRISCLVHTPIEAATVICRHLNIMEYWKRDYDVKEHHDLQCYECRCGVHLLQVPKLESERPYTLEECEAMLNQKYTRVNVDTWVEVKIVDVLLPLVANNQT